MIGELANGITSAVGSAFSQATTAVAALLEGIIGPPGGEPIQAAQATGAAIGQGVADGRRPGRPRPPRRPASRSPTAVKTSLTLDQIPMDLQGVKDVIAGAGDNMGTLDAAGQRVKETVRGISAEMLALQHGHRPAPLPARRREGGRTTPRSSPSATSSTPSTPATPSGSKSSGWSADLAVLEAQRALEIAKGDQAVRARLDAEIQELQILQQAMQLDERRRALAELIANPPGTMSPAERALEEFRRPAAAPGLGRPRGRDSAPGRAERQKKQEDDEDDREYRAAQDRLRRQKEEQAAKDRALAAEIRRLTEQEAAVRAKYRDIDLAEEAAANERKRQMREKAFQERMTEIADELGELDKQQRRVARMGGRGMHDALRAIEKQRKNLLKQQGQLVHSREEEIRTEQEQARKAERRRLMEAELAVLDAQKKSLEEQRQANRAIIAESAGRPPAPQAGGRGVRGVRRRDPAPAGSNGRSSSPRSRRPSRPSGWPRRRPSGSGGSKRWQLALQIAEKEAERDRLGDAAAIRRAEQALSSGRGPQAGAGPALGDRGGREPDRRPSRSRTGCASWRPPAGARSRPWRPRSSRSNGSSRCSSLQRQEWQAVAPAIKDATDKLKEAAKGKQDGLNLGRVEIDTSALDDFKKKLADGQEAAKAFVNGFGTWIKENLVALGFGGIGALIGGALFGPLGRHRRRGLRLHVRQGRLRTSCASGGSTRTQSGRSSRSG